MKEDTLEIINHYGVRNQLKKLNEECYELIEAIRDYEEQKQACEFVGCSRIHADKERKHIVEELGDVRFMLLQFQNYYEIADEEIEEVMRFKDNRQLERISKE